MVEKKRQVQQAETLAKKMEPKMIEELHHEDKQKFIKNIKFTEVSINPLGGVNVRGIINGNKEYTFRFILQYDDFDDVGTYTLSNELNRKIGSLD